MKKLSYLILICVAVLAVPIFMTSSICHVRFAWAWTLQGQCGVTDAPSEVFMSFLILSLIGWSVFFVILAAAKLLSRKTAQ